MREFLQVPAFVALMVSDTRLPRCKTPSDVPPHAHSFALNVFEREVFGRPILNRGWFK
jgi:hypothetical protein